MRRLQYKFLWLSCKLSVLGAGAEEEVRFL